MVYMENTVIFNVNDYGTYTFKCSWCRFEHNILISDTENI